MIGPVATAGSITLAPQSTTNMSLVGRLLPQESEDGLAVVSDIFNNFIHGKDSNVSVHGANAGPSDVCQFSRLQHAICSLFKRR